MSGCSTAAPASSTQQSPAPLSEYAAVTPADGAAGLGGAAATASDDVTEGRGGRTKRARIVENELPTARGGAGGGLGYRFRSQPHVCFCGGDPCLHRVFTGESSRHCVSASKQEPTDRAQATNFVDSINVGTALASAGDLDDSTAGNEPIWLSLAKGKKQVADAPFQAAGGAGPSGTRTVRTNWTYVDVQWLVKVKTDSAGNVHYEAWAHPRGERTVLTKPKILTVPIEWLRVEERHNVPTRYVLSASMYQRLLDAVK